jgi:hypothetical protein
VRVSLVHNEQTKLTATWLNGIAIASIAVGGIAPFVAAILGTSGFVPAFVTGVTWLTIGAGLHWMARRILRRLIE